MAPVAETGAELTAGAITAMLRAAGHDLTVVGTAAERIGTGQMGVTYRVALDYEGPAGPPALIAKLAAEDPVMRSLVSPGYAAEVGFYREVAAGLTVRTPGCWYAGIADDRGTFTLLLDDASPAEPGVQAKGCSLEQAEAAVDNLVGLHAPRWNDDGLWQLDFLMKPNEGTATMMGDILVSATEGFVERYEAQLGPDDPATLRAAAAVTTRWQLTRLEPFSVVHGDYRLDNLLFPPGGGPVTAVDWQSAAIGPPLRDVAYFLGTSLRTEVRRAEEARLVGRYHDALLAAGVTGYDRDRCWADYRLGHLQAPMITIIGCMYATGERSESSDRMFTAMATRAAAAIRDHGSIDLV